MEYIDPLMAVPLRTLKEKQAIPWIVFLIFFAVLNETVFNVSTPAIAAQFSLSASEVGWVMTIFIVFFGMGSVIYGKLSDIFSLRRLIVFGVCVYCAGSLVGFGMRSFFPAVVAARALQGMGASAIPALIMVVVARYFPAERRGRVFGTLTSTVALASGTGPVLGGFVAGSLHWSYLFLIPLATLGSLPYFIRALPAEKGKKGSIDVLGALLTGAVVASLILFLSFSSWYFPVAGAAALALLILRINRAKNPFIDPALLKNRGFRSGMMAGFLIFGSSIGIIFLTPLMMNALHGLGTAEIGLIMFPGAISGIVFGTLGGALADKKGNRFVVALGLSALVASLLFICSVLEGTLWLISTSLFVTFVGFTLIQTGLINGVSQTLEVAQTGVGMGLFNLATFISAAAGTTFVGRFIDGGWLSVRVNPAVSGPDAFTYSNLLLIFAVLISLAGLVYFRGGGRKSLSVREPESRAA